MELKNDFRVALPVERAWAVLTDVERIAPCLPGAQLQEVEGDEYRGVVKVKVGPITAQYKGSASFVELDTAVHKAVLRAEGRETRGQGNASATITATLTPEGDGTAVSVLTDLTVTGKVAQFGRGVLADVSAKLLGQFVECLEQTVLADEPSTVIAEPADGEAAERSKIAAGAAEVAEQAAAVGDPGPTAAPVTAPAAVTDAEPPAATPEPAAPRKIDMPEPKPVDLLEAAGRPVAKRVGPVLAIVAIAWVLKKLLSRR